MFKITPVPLITIPVGVFVTTPDDTKVANAIAPASMVESLNNWPTAKPATSGSVL